VKTYSEALDVNDVIVITQDVSILSETVVVVEVVEIPQSLSEVEYKEYFEIMDSGNIPALELPWRWDSSPTMIALLRESEEDHAALIDFLNL
jgi:hypothetical protein